MLNLVDKTILLSHLKDGREQMKSHKILLERLLGMAIERVGAELRYGNVSLDVAPFMDVVVDVDENLMVTAIACLLGKAAKLAELGSVIKITAGNDYGCDNEVSIMVEAKGTPVGESAIPCESFPFLVGDVAHHGRGSGGLDLYIADHVIEAHNGKMYLESQGATTRFVLTLPRATSDVPENSTSD